MTNSTKSSPNGNQVLRAPASAQQTTVTPRWIHSGFLPCILESSRQSATLSCGTCKLTLQLMESRRSEHHQGKRRTPANARQLSSLPMTTHHGVVLSSLTAFCHLRPEEQMRCSAYRKRLISPALVDGDGSELPPVDYWINASATPFSSRQTPHGFQVLERSDYG
jgi:hypothetical protein